MICNARNYSAGFRLKDCRNDSGMNTLIIFAQIGAHVQPPFFQSLPCGRDRGGVKCGIHRTVNPRPF